MFLPITTMYIGTLYPHPPYSFQKLLAFLMRRTHPSLDIVWGDAYWRALRLGGGMGLVRVTASGTVQDPALEVDLVRQEGEVDHEKGLQDGILETLTHVLGTRTDRQAFFQMAQENQALWQVVEPVYGLPALQSTGIFDALVTTIIEQQITWISAQHALRWLLEWGGSRIEHAGRQFYDFPAPARIARATLEELKPLKITFRRTGLLTSIAQDWISGRLNLEKLGSNCPEALYENLLRIKGVGPWTAAVTVNRACGHEYYVAHGDVALQAAVNRYFFGLESRAAPGTVTELFARLDPFAGQAAFYTLARWVFDQYSPNIGLYVQASDR